MTWEGRTAAQGSTRAGRAARHDCLNHAGHRCQLRHPGCTTVATEAHHVNGLADTGRTRAEAVDHHQLVAACHSCHDVETRAQADRGRSRWKRRPERHPGHLW
jgi:hypothetical protein